MGKVATGGREVQSGGRITAKAVGNNVHGKPSGKFVGKGGPEYRQESAGASGGSLGSRPEFKQESAGSK